MSDKKPHPLEVAWAAGIFEGKGSFPRNVGSVLRFDSTDGQMVKRFKEVVGVGTVNNLGYKKGSINEVWRWQTQAHDDCRETLLMLSPFFGPRKTVLASDIIARVERNPYWRKKYPKKAASLVTKSADAE